MDSIIQAIEHNADSEGLMSTNLSGPGSNRQAKRLQLRKAGFRAKAVAQRQVTPRHDANAVRSRSASGCVGSPSAVISNMDGAGDTPDKNERIGVLKEISNSSRRIKKQVRPRIDDGFSIFHDENPVSSPKAAQFEREKTEAFPDCMTPESTGRSRDVSRRFQRSAATQRRQSVGIDTTKYIEHLEAELAATQTQLSSMTSPTVLQARSHKMRALNAESQALQKEVAQWEAKFHDRVQEEIDERNKLETRLKAQIRTLEVGAEEYAQKMRELQVQLEASAATISATETANDELEKRIDAITDLVGSPKKNDLERCPTSPRKRHMRNKSFLPRFPTTGSLTIPLKPAEFPVPLTPHAISQLPMAAVRVDSAIDIEASLQDPAALLDMAFLDQSAALSDPPSSSCSSKRFSWSTPDSQPATEPIILASTGKPSRRMRRFHATNMPKPLLLPSTASGMHSVPMTAPPMERTPPAFPFPDLPEVSEIPPIPEVDFFLSPAYGPSRRRARTSADVELRRISANFLTATTPSTASSSGGPRLPSPLSKSAEVTPRDYSSLGSAVGRNLFEELQRAKNADSGESDCQRITSGASDETERPSTAFSSYSTSWRSANLGCHGVRRRAWTSHQRSVSEQTGLSRHRLQSRNINDLAGGSQHDAEHSHFWHFFSDLWRQSLSTARQSLAYAQSVTIRTASVRKLQWFLIELFLGPQVARRMMASSMRRRDRSRSFLELHDLSLTSPPSHRSRGGRSALEVELETFSQVAMQRVERPLQVERKGRFWWERHSPWLWIRFSLTLAFAIGAAIRDGPGVVMGVDGAATV